MKSLKMLINLLIMSALLMCLVLASAWWLGGSHKERVIAFWGDAYRPEAPAVEPAFPLSLLIPSGGPLIANSVVGCGGGATQLPVVPLRYVEGDEVEVLCGIGEDAYVHRLAVADIKNAEARDALRNGRGGE